MREYPKIETVFERATDGSKKLIDGKYRDETVQFLSDNVWEWTEKFDGTNIRVHWDGHRVTFGGRTDRANIPVNLLNVLTGIFATNEAEELFEQKFGETEVTLYGEGYGAGIQTGGNYRNDVSFILFDVLVGVDDNSIWLRRDGVEDVAVAFGVDFVPVVLEGTIQEAVDFVKAHPASTVGTAFMEGVVGRPKCELFNRLGKRLMVKVKYRDFANKP